MKVAFFSMLALLAFPARPAEKVAGVPSGTAYAEEAFAGPVERGELPGAINVFYDNGRVEVSCLGYSDLENRRKISLDDIFMQCSQTKGFCGVTVAMLVEDGKVSLDDPVSKYLPEFKTLWVQTSDTNGVRVLRKARNALTLRMCLNHTGGLPFELPNYELMGGWSRRMPLRSVAVTASSQPLLFEPGTSSKYSNVGIDIAAAVVEAVSGKRWEGFLQERLFGPLEMSRSTFWPTKEDLARRIRLYRVFKDKPPRAEDESRSMQRPFADDRVFPSAGAGLWTTARDQLKFYKMLMNLGVGENGVRVMKEETVRNLLARSSRADGEYGYSLGMVAPEKAKDDENAWFGHGGAWVSKCMVNYHRKQLKLFVVQLVGDGCYRFRDVSDRAADRFFGSKLDNSAVNAFTGRLGEARPTPVLELSGSDMLSRCGTGNFKNRITFTNDVVAGEDAFVVCNLNKGREDTSWSLTTQRFRVTPGREYALHVRSFGDFKVSGAKPPTHIGWFDAGGKALMTMDALNNEIPFKTVLSVDTGSESWRNTLKKGRVPAGAAFAHVQFSADYPNLHPGERFCLSRLAYYERGDGDPWDFGDMSAPELRMLTASPAADRNAPVAFEVSDRSEIDWTRFACSINGKDVTKELSRDGRKFVYRSGRAWGDGDKIVLSVQLADVHGNSATRFGFVSFDASKPVHAKASLRDDGMVLRDGEPFFPIGVYSVRKCVHNGGDLDRAVAELKAGGINLIGTYLTHSGPKAQEYRELVDACNKHGMQFWAQPDPAHKRTTFERIFASVADGMRQPCAFMWEIGDDTAFHRSADELRADHEACHAVDPHILTSQADISPNEDRITPYARYADIFKSENYPVRKETPQPGEIAEMSRDLTLAMEDLRRGGANPPCLFSIVQSFVGWGWKRYPSEEELRCMSYLAIALRARGLTYYTYHSDNGKGVSSTPERMRAFTKLTREISSLQHDLVSRDAAVQPKCEILSGPKSASYNQRPVALLLKESGLFVAVNVTDGPLKVRFTMPDGRSFEHDFGRCGVYVSSGSR